MKKVALDIYWILSEVNADLIKKIILDKNFGFDPKESSFIEDAPINEVLVAFSQLDILQDHSSFSIWGVFNKQKANLFFSVSEWGNEKLLKIHISIYCRSEAEIDFYKAYLIVPDILCAFIYDGEDELWQSTESIDYYIEHHKSYAELPQTVNIVGKNAIDISGNFGRSFHLLGIKFIAAAIIFYNEFFLKIVPFEVSTLADLKMLDIIYQSNALIGIKIYDLFDNDVTSIRNRQRSFLEASQLFERLSYLKKNFRGTFQILTHLKSKGE
jgi:hypothetical protein